MFLRHHNRGNVFFDVVVPDSPQAKTYLENQNFWNRFNFTPDPEIDKDILRLWPTTSFKDIVNLQNVSDQAEDVGNKLQEIIQRNHVRVDSGEVRIAVTELVQNFVEHAEQGLAVMMAQYYPTKQVLKIAVGDCGIGIKESLLKSGQYPYIADFAHKDAIVEAFQPLVTCKGEGGMGFDVVREIAQDQGVAIVPIIGRRMYLP